MPKVTVYIRNEDVEKWQAVGQKTEFLHRALSDSPTFPDEPAQAPVYTSAVNKMVAAVSKLKDDEVFKPCKHGADPKFCRFAKAGKPCK